VSQIYPRIARITRSRKTLAIGLVTALLIIAFAVNSVYSVGSCQKQASIKTIDEMDGKDSRIRFSVDSNSNTIDSAFYTYQLAISKYVLLKVDEIEKCTGKTDRDPQIELAFVYRPLDNGRTFSPFTFELPKFKNTRYLDSPWVKLTITKTPKLKVRAVFLWNQRQFMLDQAVLSGARVSSTAPLLPLDRSTYMKFLGNYSGKWEATLSESEEVKAAVFADLAKRLPEDLMWLFSHSRNFDGNLLAEWAMDKAIEQQVEQYIDLTKKLLNRRFKSTQAEQRYSSILDLKNMFDLDRYRINEIRYH
jgi:hypothetical protein